MMSDRGENCNEKLWMFNDQQKRYGMRREKIKNLILMVLTITLVFGINIKALKAEGDFDKFIKPVTNPVNCLSKPAFSCKYDVRKRWS